MNGNHGNIAQTERFVMSEGKIKVFHHLAGSTQSHSQKTIS